MSLSKQSLLHLSITPCINIIKGFKSIVSSKNTRVSSLPQVLQCTNLAIKKGVHRLCTNVTCASASQSVVTRNIINHKRMLLRVSYQIIHCQVNTRNHLFRFILRSREVRCILLCETFSIQKTLTACKSQYK